MTVQAMAAWKLVRAQLDDVLDSLTHEEWLRPSACAGWRVRDVVAHLGAGARSVIDPLPEPPDAAPMPEDRERQHDVLVLRRDEWSVEQVLEEYRTYAPKLGDLVAGFQHEPQASAPFTVPGLGVYPMHALANGQVFDYYCHLRHDLLGPAGPIDRVLPPPEHETVYAAVQWMMWGLPQMQGDALDTTVTAPVTFRLTGPGESEWTVTRPDPDGHLAVEERGGGDVVVTSDAHAFIAWGTTRRDWRPDCTITGPESLATPLLDALDIV
ncbi:maleylpyruvate isomerase N-terminal domain-containing protein [Streptomyces sp. BV129]|uniref:maleylpyruvate isomerase N-terminal domain-containing protein n=1 Tax=Streptomyces sp. BV129 TaxID=2849671 RepID=UPI001C2E4A6F|nr:maleylpyruvate isomerase N-terminal domain-containing protein [Streptomyces sp. BV129]MBV1949044.1 maleylpyruvate isomerase N-terminal domain-containing protein [Streptomyces sp. BV129]